MPKSVTAVQYEGTEKKDTTDVTGGGTIDLHEDTEYVSVVVETHDGQLIEFTQEV